MNLFALFALCFVPPIAFLALFSLCFEKSVPFKYALSCFFGLLTLAPSSFLQYFALKIPIFQNSTFFSVFFTAIVFNGLIEEVFKLSFIALVPKKNQNLWTFFCCSILLGAAAGSLETAIYASSSLRKIALVSAQTDALRLIFLRMCSAQTIHILSAALLGIFVWGCAGKIRHAILFCYAVFLHGLFNFFIAFDGGMKFFSLAVIFFALAECRVWYKIVKNEEFEDKKTADFFTKSVDTTARKR